ncbi:MAG: GAF domain-containing protein [Polyangiaceae bacterium]|nr:GAF domain-containing protein [Polyangiaceae bacterium]
MSEGLLLPPAPRARLPLPARLARLEDATPQLLAAVAGETDLITLQATLACLLWETMLQASWCGFYRRVAERELAVGPYQGPLGCLRISLDRGVCGLAAREARVVYVADVREVADHIACDGAARSELVVPVTLDGRVEAVLDLDSHEQDAFSEEEGARLSALLARAFADARR